MSEQFYEFQLKSIDGTPTKMRQFEGKVLLLVNVASKCGLTPQYEALESLYEKFHSRGFEILGFPANEFGAQEPGSNQEIQQFCRANFGIKFPMFEKIVVKGENIHPLYDYLTKAKNVAKAPDGSQFEKKLRDFGVPAGEKHEILWNFEKFLINKKGQVIERFAPDVEPNSPMIVAAIEKEIL